MVLMTVEAFERIVLLTMADCATDNEIVPVTIVRTIFMTMDTSPNVHCHKDGAGVVTAQSRS
jgi:hypothetical protein